VWTIEFIHFGEDVQLSSFKFFQFDRAVRLFGEDNSTIQPDDFYGIFDAFLTAFIEAHQDNENMKRRREEEEKRAAQEAEVSILASLWMNTFFPPKFFYQAVLLRNLVL
jgi:hypothetical protein